MGVYVGEAPIVVSWGEKRERRGGEEICYLPRALLRRVFILLRCA